MNLGANKQSGPAGNRESTAREPILHWLTGAFTDPESEAQFAVSIWPERRKFGIATTSTFFCTLTLFTAGLAVQSTDGIFMGANSLVSIALGGAGAFVLAIGLLCFLTDRNDVLLDVALFLPSLTCSAFLAHAGWTGSASWPFLPGVIMASTFVFGTVIPQRPGLAMASIGVLFLDYWIVALEFGTQFQSLPAILITGNCFGCAVLVRNGARVRRLSFIQQRELRLLSESLTHNVQSLELENAAVERAAMENAQLADELALARMAAEENATLVDVILDTISKGVIAFSPDARVIKCNQVYADFMRLPEHLVKPGTPLQDIFEHAWMQGVLSSSEERDRIADKMLELAATRDFAPFYEERKRPSGAIFELRIHPLPAGGGVATLADITDQKMAEAAIRHKALHDPLTGLANRELFYERLAMAIARSKRNGHYAALAMIDLDKFKPVNDEYGHPAGDAVLRKVSEIFQRSVRETDIVARLGGDEFAIIFDGVSRLADISLPLDRILNRLATPISVGDIPIRIGASIGVALYPLDAGGVDELEKAADDALLQAKQAGKNRYHFGRQEDDADKLASVSNL